MTITSSVTNSVLCNNAGTLTVSTAGTLTNTPTGVLNNFGAVINNRTLTNNGLITNTGSITNTGNLNGSGTLNNTGTVAVTSGNVSIANSSNLSSGTLTGGTWIVGGSGSSKSKATLAIGSGAITTNNANIELISANASFGQLAGLANNTGSLAVGGGAKFSSASLYNTGTLTVTSGGFANVTNSKNLSGGTLTGGTWVVDNSGGTSKLTVGSGAITTNDANIELIGTGALSSFSQLASLANNAGSLTVGAGASLGSSKISKMSLYNTGTLTVTSGGVANITNSKNLAGGTLTGGTWVVDGSSSSATLAIGSGNITTNKANIELIGANANFTQLSALANNQGTLTIGSGASYATSASLNNTGTIVTTAGGTLNLNVANAKSKQQLTLTNNGSVENAGTISGKGDFINAGSLVIESTGALSGFDHFLQTSGVTTLRNGGNLAAKNVQFLGGTLAGSGTIDPPSPIVIGSKAIVAPTNMLTLEGNTEFNGELDIGIFGAGNYSVLNVIGAIDFGAGSKIDFSFDPTFNLTDSSYLFKFLLASDDILGLGNPVFDYTGLDPLYTSKLNLECQSGGCDYSLLLTRNDNSGEIPEPGTFLLTTLGLLGFAFGPRKSFFSRFQRTHGPTPVL